MATGERPRPARILIVATGVDVDRIARALRRAGHVVFVAAAEAEAVETLAVTPVAVVVVDGIDAGARARVLRCAELRGAWSVYLVTPNAAPLSADERSRLIAAVSLDADDARITTTIGTVLAARGARRTATGGSS